MESSFNPISHNFSGCTEILRNILLRPPSPPCPTFVQGSLHADAQMNPIRQPSISSGVLMSSVPPSQSSLAIPHNLVTHTLGPMKSQGGGSYPLQLHLGGALGSGATVNVPMQLSTATSSVGMSMPMQLSAPVSLPGNVPVQLPGGAAINVPLQFPAPTQSHMLPSMPLLQTSVAQPFNSSIIHVHVGGNAARTYTSAQDSLSEPIYSTTQIQVPTSATGVTQVTNPIHVMPGSAPSSSLLGMGGGMRGNVRGVPQVVYINQSGHKPAASASINTTTIGNPKQIIVRRPVTNSGMQFVSIVNSDSNLATKGNIQNKTRANGLHPIVIKTKKINPSSNMVTNTSGIQFVSNVNTKSNLAPKVNMQNKPLPGNSSQPIVIQKPKLNSNLVPVSIPTNTGSKQTFAYLGTVKKQSMNKPTENQSILLPNNQINTNINQPSNQKLFLAPMSMPKIQNTKFIMPVTLPGSMTNKGPVINLQIANGQLQNDAQGNITVMRESSGSDMPPLQPLGKLVGSVNGKDVPQTSRGENAFAISIPGSRVEPTGEQEYTLSIPETNASMNDDIYTVSIADEDEGSAQEKSFTLAIPEKGKSLLNKTLIEKSDAQIVIPAPAILRRSNSDNTEKRLSNNANVKRRISLCTEKVLNKKHHSTQLKTLLQSQDPRDESDNNDDHQVPSLFCDEKLDKDLELKVNPGESETQEFKDNTQTGEESRKSKTTLTEYKRKPEVEVVKEDALRVVRESTSVDMTSEEDPPGLVWNNGIALLQGSDLHFQTNEFGLIDVMEHHEQVQSFLLNPSSKYQTPLKQRLGRTGRDKKPTSPEDLYCCDGCGCHGMAADFITPNFCSLTCQQLQQKLAPQKKKERDKAELMKKRNRMKKLLAQQRFHSELFGEKQPADPAKPPEPDSRLINPLLLKVEEEEPFENEKYPWMCGKNGFSWMRYLDFCKAKAAPAKLFAKDPFPYNTKNGFKVGMKLEAIDPMRPAVFSVVTVAETQGYRMRLHFDSYPDTFDYWVNADSIDIFPASWCERNGRVLKPPQGFTATNFSWAQYLKQCKAVAAPKHLFPHMCQTMLKPNGFRTGMKLEADDRKNNLTCVATVSDMLDNRILVNFDSWDEKYDYWVDPTSPYIHPVGWAEENGHSLTPPNFYKDPDSFTWEGYLRETGAAAVPARAFKPRPPHGFRQGMKLEVVDRRAPFLIRVATVSDRREHAVRVSYDGWPDPMSLWLDDDCPDLHPVGWCLKTGHPLEPPLSVEELKTEGPCGVGGCRGLGSLSGGAHKTHAAASQCPYRLASPPSPPDRLAPPTPAPATHLLPRTRTISAPQRGRPPKYATSTPTSDTQQEKNLRVRPAKHKRVEEITKSVDQISDEDSNGSSVVESKRSRTEAELEAEAEAEGGAEAEAPREAEVEASVLAREYVVRAGLREPHWSVMCPDVALVLRQAPLPSDPRVWSQEDVREFVESAAVTAEVGERFSEHRIGGADFLMLSQEEMVDVLGLKLGPAIKIYSTILQLRKTVLS